MHLIQPLLSDAAVQGLKAGRVNEKLSFALSTKAHSSSSSFATAGGGGGGRGRGFASASGGGGHEYTETEEMGVFRDRKKGTLTLNKMPVIRYTVTYYTHATLYLIR